MDAFKQPPMRFVRALPALALALAGLTLGVSGCTGDLRAAAGRVPGTQARVSILDNELPVAEWRGSEAQMGAQAGQLLGSPMRHLIGMVRLSPQFRISDADLATMEKHIRPEHLAELAAMAKAAGIDGQRLLTANVALDTLCTVLVTGADGTGPVRVARNMDFFPAEFLGPASVVVVRRPPGKHAFAAVSWPGYGGVISGMNDAGVVACILQNLGSDQTVRDGTPIAFRAREILETAGNLEQAAAAFAAAPLASSHFVMLADSRHACVVWQDNGNIFHRKDATNGWLSWSNGNPDADGKQDDRRALCLAGVCAAPPQGPVSDDWLKAQIIQVRLKALNAQVMLFNPRDLSLEVACASFWRGAGHRPWTRVDLKPYFFGAAGRPAK